MPINPRLIKNKQPKLEQLELWQFDDDDKLRVVAQKYLSSTVNTLLSLTNENIDDKEPHEISRLIDFVDKCLAKNSEYWREVRKTL